MSDARHYGDMVNGRLGNMDIKDTTIEALHYSMSRNLMELCARASFAKHMARAAADAKEKLIQENESLRGDIRQLQRDLERQRALLVDAREAEQWLRTANDSLMDFIERSDLVDDYNEFLRNSDEREDQDNPPESPDPAYAVDVKGPS